MFVFLLSVYVLISILLILIVLLQMGRGAEMGAAFGNIGQTQLPYTPENFLGKITTYVAVVFMLMSLLLAYLSAKNSSSSVINNISTSNPAEQSAPAGDNSP